MRSYRESDQVHWAEEKKDGFRCTIHKRKTDDVLAVGEKLDLWPRLIHCDLIRDPVNLLPDDTIIDCEVFAPGIHASSVPTLINEGRAQISVFACPQFEGRSTLYQTPMFIHGFIGGLGLQQPDGFSVPFYPDKDELLQLARERSLEGWVLKFGSYDEWYKLKVHRTLDAVVVDWNLGNGKYATKLGAIKVAVFRGDELVEIATVGSGFVDTDRVDCDVIGRVAEVEYDSVAAKGRLRFPRFVRWREDKSARACIYEQLENNE